ncbi:corticotropin-releasing factor receptor 2 isoform X1 [Dermatophagoides farinae]|uniref:corticotropin-releasing factor receptor 2 isoform X1 n=1 Tax=Dermatophagoides farinae TaxID=6954 RepID=UPI003F62523B
MKRQQLLLSSSSLLLLFTMMTIQWSNSGQTITVSASASASVSWKPKSYCHSPANILFDNIDEFTNAMCTYCLYTMYTKTANFVWRDGYKFDRLKFIDHSHTTNVLVIMENSSYAYYYEIDLKHLQQQRLNGLFREDPILQDFSNEYYMDKFLKCCQDSHDCCEQMINRSVDNDDDNDNNDDHHCPMIWDGWTCWMSAEPDSMSKTKCPDMSLMAFHYDDDDDNEIPLAIRSNAVKKCQSNGTWIQHTDYRDCSILAKDVRQSVVKTRIILQSISIILSIGAVTIFIYLRLYVKFYIQLLLNFFTSIILSTMMALLYDIYVTKGHLQFSDNVILQNQKYCRTFTFLYKETRMMNYSWMLIEGIFLHNSAVFAFHCKKMSEWRRTIYIFGWFVPNIIMAIYGVIRLKHSDSMDRCWTDTIGTLEWTFMFFPYFCFFFNLLLYCNLIRFILIKTVFINNGHTKEFTWIKLATILMPIFGIQYTIYMVTIDPTATTSLFLLAIFRIQNIVESLQGTIVTIILCFLNKDVYRTIRKSIVKSYGRRKSNLLHSALSTQITMTDSSKQYHRSESTIKR